MASDAPMLLAEPPPSQADLHFRIAGIPVRVHPFFWLVTLMTGLGGRESVRPEQLVIWIVVVFVSILVHELGHAFLQRHFGGRPWITLHGIGGLASCDDCDRSPQAQILISLAGPAAGFIAAALVIAAVRLSGHVIGLTAGDDIPWERAGIASARALTILGATTYWEPFTSNGANTLLHNILFVNIVWGLVNLLPVYPLDGGRVAREVLTLRQPRRGIIWSYQLSMGTAAAMAVYGLITWELFIAVMFGYLAYTSYQALQSYQRNY